MDSVLWKSSIEIILEYHSVSAMLLVYLKIYTSWKNTTMMAKQKWHDVDFMLYVETSFINGKSYDVEIRMKFFKAKFKQYLAVYYSRFSNLPQLSFLLFRLLVNSLYLSWCLIFYLCFLSIISVMLPKWQSHQNRY